MTENFFQEAYHSLDNLIGDIGLGRIGLPDILRPFVASHTNIRDFFNSIYRAYPVGHLPFWQTNAKGVDSKVVGDTNKRLAPSFLFLDGQRRLASLYIAIRCEMARRHPIVGAIREGHMTFQAEGG